MNDNFDFPIVWIDLELTGLDINKDMILEIAVIVTDGQLQNRKEGPCLIINCSNDILDNMNEWCTTHHKESGLTSKVKESKISLKEAETMVLNFLKNDCNIKEGIAIIAGNSIHMDKIFLMKDMPNLNNYLHYRIIDVSSLKSLCQMWYPEIYKKVPRKKGSHRALDDIKESIEELEFYRKNIMITNK